MGFWHKVLGRRRSESSAAPPVGGAPTPEEAVRRYFAAVAAHDLEGILNTLCPQRARLYSDARTLDRRRQSVAGVEVLSVEPADVSVPLPPYAEAYPHQVTLRVEYAMRLVPPEQRRDPTLREGRQWIYFLLVSEGSGKPWLIADWGL